MISKMRISLALHLALLTWPASISGRRAGLEEVSAMKVLHLDTQADNACPSPLHPYCCYELDYSGDQVGCTGMLP